MKNFYYMLTLIFVVSIFNFLSFVSASTLTTKLGYDNSKLPHLNSEIITTSNIFYNTTYNTWAYNQTQSAYFYNMSDGGRNPFNQWLNKTDNATFYNTSINNILSVGNQIRVGNSIFGANLVMGAGKNVSAEYLFGNVSTFNATYAEYAYNQTDTIYFYNMSDGTGADTLTGNNVSFDEINGNLLNITYLYGSNTTNVFIDRTGRMFFERNSTGMPSADRTKSILNFNYDALITGCQINVTQGSTVRYSLCGDTWNTAGVSTWNLANLALTGNYITLNKYNPTLVAQIFNASYSTTPAQLATSTGSLAWYYTQAIYTRTNLGDIAFIPAQSLFIRKLGNYGYASLNISENSSTTTGNSIHVFYNDTGATAFSVARNGNVYIDGDLNVTDNVHIDGNVSFKRPYGMFSDTSSQTVAVANTPYAMKFNTTEDAFQVYKAVDNANFSFGQTGDYLIELSIMGKSSVANTHLEVWVKKNGVNIPRSNTRYEFKGVNSEAVISVPFIIDMNMTDKFEVWYAGDSNGVSLPYTTNTSYSPETPSVIITISKISEVTD